MSGEGARGRGPGPPSPAHSRCLPHLHGPWGGRPSPGVGVPWVMCHRADSRPPVVTSTGPCEGTGAQGTPGDAGRVPSTAAALTPGTCVLEKGSEPGLALPWEPQWQDLRQCPESCLSGSPGSLSAVAWPPGGHPGLPDRLQDTALEPSPLQRQAPAPGQGGRLGHPPAPAAPLPWCPEGCHREAAGRP